MHCHCTGRVCEHDRLLLSLCNRLDWAMRVRPSKGKCRVHNIKHQHKTPVSMVTHHCTLIVVNWYPISAISFHTHTHTDIHTHTHTHKLHSLCDSQQYMRVMLALLQSIHTLCFPLWSCLKENSLGPENT